MNLTTGSTFSTTWKRVRLHHLIAAAGVALAVSTFVALGGLGTGGTETVARPAAPVQTIQEAPAAPPTVRQEVVYIVETGQDALNLEASLTESAKEAFIAGSDWPSEFSIIAVDTPKGKTAAQDLVTWVVAENEAQGGNLKVIDLRTQ